MRLLFHITGAALALMVGALPAAAQSGPGARLAEAALARTAHRVSYDPAYVVLAYPMGDVAADRGVCSDVIIRAYRALGIDLQVKVHEDMRRAFSAYPRRWGLKRPDRNIDHRRVPNLRVFFSRHGRSLGPGSNPADYRPGDLITWDLKGSAASSLTHTRLPHIGIVTARRSADGKRPLIVHNIGNGPQLEDMMLDFKITGHYRYFGHGSGQ
ncbi:MAG: DUF1287 domain-containing protein [Hyphomicrobiales bacterium]|nr:MAG: DUF1287 domain-containing protein [Hyphomicrobiales bacterium]